MAIAVTKVRWNDDVLALIMGEGKSVHFAANTPWTACVIEHENGGPTVALIVDLGMGQHVFAEVDAVEFLRASRAVEILAGVEVDLAGNVSGRP